MIKKLKTDLKCKDEELCKVSKICNDALNQIVIDFKHLKTELSDTKSHTSQVEKKLKIEREVISNKLMTVCNKLQETKCAFDEAKCLINDDVSKIKSAITKISKLTEGEENKQQNLEKQVQQLKEESCIKDEALCRMNKKIKDLQLNNEYYKTKFNKQIKQLQEWKLKIENNHE